MDSDYNTMAVLFLVNSQTRIDQSVRPGKKIVCKARPPVSVLAAGI